MNNYDKSVIPGILLDTNGKLKGIEVNTYVRHLVKCLNLRIDKSGYYYIYEDGVWGKLEELELRRILRKFLNERVRNGWNQSVENQYMSALPLICPSTDQLASAENVINVKNGLFHTDTFELTKHDENVFSTIRIPVVYDTKAKCPLFKDFLQAVFDGDQERVALLQDITGFTLTNDTRHQKLFILCGDGANGKSTLLEILIELVGGPEHVSSIALAHFENKFELSQIVDKKLNISSEHTMKQSALETRNLKAITGGDYVQIQKKYKQPFSYKPMAKLIFALNKMPLVHDDTYGFIRRLVVIPFDVRFVENPTGKNQAKIDLAVKEKLLGELDGIFAWAIKGLKRLVRNDYIFTESRRVNDLLGEFMREINSYLYFVDKFVVQVDESAQANKRISTEVMYYAYKVCSAEGGTKRNSYMSERETLMDKRNVLKGIRAALEQKGISYSCRKCGGPRFFYGITLTKRAVQLLRVRPEISDAVKGDIPKQLLG
jgi:putative DNA primase/helicase